MKKIILCIMILASCSVSAYANVKLPMVQYKCEDCGDYFYAFKGDDLESLEFTVPSNQWNRLFRLSNREAHLDPCKGKLTHNFKYKDATDVPMSEISRNASLIVVVKNGKKLQGIKFSSWWCLYEGCNSIAIIYSMNEENLMIRDWEQQPDMLRSLKGAKGIPKCDAKDVWGNTVWGHAFFFDSGTKDHEITSHEIAEMAEDIYYVK